MDGSSCAPAIALPVFRATLVTIWLVIGTLPAFVVTGTEICQCASVRLLLFPLTRTSHLNVFPLASSCPNKFAAERPLLVKSLYHGSVLDLSCELGYDLRVNASTSESYDQTPKTFSSYLTSSMRVYCVGTDWIIDDWSKLSQFGVVRRTPIHSLPTCEGNFFSTKSIVMFD